MFHPRTTFRAAAVLGAVAATTVALAPSALAGPDNRHTIPVQVNCADGSSYSLTTLDADSPWGAFHYASGTGAVIPAYYSDVHVRVSTSDGTVLFENDSSDYTPRGAVPDGLGEIKDCAFQITDSFPDPDLGQLTTTVDVALGLWVAPAGRSR